jgi:phosphonate transport system substrate-binding protein
VEWGVGWSMRRGKKGKELLFGLLAGLLGMLLLFAGQTVAAPVLVTADEAASTQRPLQFGLLPYLSTRKLFAYYTPMQKYLEKVLGRPVRMSTAPDFATYIKRAQQGMYDLYHTAPHFAAQAEVEFGYRRVSRLLRELDGSIVVARDGSISNVADLRGRTMITPDALAIISFLGEQWLRDNHLQPGVDVEVKHSPSHNTAIMAVAHGDAEAAVTSAAVFENMPQRISNRLRILTSTKKVPHMMFMAGPNLSEREYQQLQKAMLAFTASKNGKAFFVNTGYGDMGKISDQDMQRLKPFIQELNTQLQQLTDQPTVEPQH